MSLILLLSQEKLETGRAIEENSAISVIAQLGLKSGIAEEVQEAFPAVPVILAGPGVAEEFSSALPALARRSFSLETAVSEELAITAEPSKMFQHASLVTVEEIALTAKVARQVNIKNKMNVYCKKDFDTFFFEHHSWTGSDERCDD